MFGLARGVLALAAAFGVGATSRELLQKAGPRVGQVLRPALKATIRTSMQVQREVKRVSDELREEWEDITAEVKAETPQQNQPGTANGEH